MLSCSCCSASEPCAAQVSIFSHLDHDSLVEISSIAVHRTVRKGEILFTPDDNRGLYLISDGNIKVYEITPSGREYLLRILHTGDFVGEDTLFNNEEAYTYGEALIDGKICFIGRDAFMELLTRHPSISMKLLEEFSRRLIRAAHQTASNSEPVLSRLAEYLLRLAAAQDSQQLELPLQLKELSSYLGTTLETLSRRLNELESRGLILRKHRRLTILNIDDLQRLI